MERWDDGYGRRGRAGRRESFGELGCGREQGQEEATQLADMKVALGCLYYSQMTMD